VIAYGYVRVSTHEQRVGGLSLDAQRDAIDAGCERNRWTLADVFEDAMTAAGRYRPGLNAAVAACAAHPGAVLVVAKLDRLARSLRAYAALLDRAERDGWPLVALDTPETDTPQGEAMQRMTAVSAQLERRLISQRTNEGGTRCGAHAGVRLGRPPALSAGTRALIVELHAGARLPAMAIARELERRGAIPPHGGSRWHTSTVTRVLQRERWILPRGRRPTP